MIPLITIPKSMNPFRALNPCTVAADVRRLILLEPNFR